MLLYSIYDNNIQLCTPFTDFFRLEADGKVEELSCLFNKMSFIAEMDEIGDMKIRMKKI